MGQVAIYKTIYAKILAASGIEFKDNTRLITGTTNPTSTAVDAVKGSIYINTSLATIYQKQDNGSTTNWNAVGSTTTIGNPTDGTYDDGLLIFTSGTLIADAVDGMNEVLAKLAPTKPANLSTKTLSLTSSYSASAESTGTVHSNVTDSTTPQTSTVSSFYDGDAGTLSAEIDSVTTGSRVLTTDSDVGTYQALHITADADPYAGQSGKQGFWKALDAYIQANSTLSYASHTYQMKHSITGNTNTLTFYVDNPTTTTISSASAGNPSSSGYVSGVVTTSAGATIATAFTVNNAVGKHYNSTKIADVTGSYTSTANVSPSGPYTENQSIALSGINITVNSSVYSETPTISIKGYNSKGTAGTPSSVSLGRIDTVSNESSRKTSGSGQYPSTGYNGTYDSSQSLKTSYTEELQMLNGLYQVPSGTYSNVDYSSGMGSGTRWVTFNPTSLSNNSAFTLTFNGQQGTWSGVETSGVSIYAKVEGATGWVDCNLSYPGVGSPSNDGDAAMVYGSSSTSVKRVTFGSTTRTGQLIIRIGFPAGSNKKFTSITVGSIS